MQIITPDRAWPLHDTAATRQQEANAIAEAGPHVLMQRAGLAVAQLALALAPHARTVWIACGPGNNGGDGLEAASHLQQWGRRPVVQWLGDAAHLPADAAASLQRARSAGVAFSSASPSALGPQDLCVDALLGLGGRPAEGPMADCIDAIGRCGTRVLAVDLPTGLHADTGARHGHAVRADHTLSLLTLKPGLFTGHGRDLAGKVWFDDLGACAQVTPASAWLAGPPPQAARAHASHKGSYGDVAVIGGAPGMRGAAVLAAAAALHAGAGRVYVAPLGGASHGESAQWPELMWREPETLDLRQLALVCGCGGGTHIAAVLPRALAQAAQLVLDADALNAVALAAGLQAQLIARNARGPSTVMTPHPLEAARLLGTTTALVQADRLAAAQQLADRFGAVVVLKGSGTVVAAPGQAPRITPTGNARLATAGTGDVLAGMVAAYWAAGACPQDAACGAVFQHGAAADRWPAQQVLTASALARAAG
ncbi:bifunctional ADP-dependent NAD(P)H-hydrate dehydratase/NAD(P)H-hydrate epimerase [Pseudorhodoferax sp. Leaf267]|uniref:bifunctional ADP-dependent NAD(P)H-hydrate dehydratase/NAD(P)H-hydrate epimerase n=1 Tax=Pseudorhodoferax sp. Leaf267 TaxID=1736316 RepID=UPI0006F41DA6|nr:bifunctional ADP-dependent NAD(P)H-hydrate dehydratase/NAD(P)H-hydrate epimerase [Pseudorhodoferax sp. Leaf267]KQP17727.1 carbohydrate kinase [Pseudorhodoferax sp. Leaf267]